MKNTPRILVIDDDKDNHRFLTRVLEHEGYEVALAQSGIDGIQLLQEFKPHLVVLDINMPGMDGLALVKALRSAKIDIPVIFLTAMSDVDDRVDGLLSGGDDYMVKPFHFSELLARITALARRPKATAENSTLTVHDLTLDLLQRTAKRQGQIIDLHNKEFALLQLLIENADRVISRTLILERVWDFNFDPGTSVVETHVSKLRQKIDKPFDVPLLHTMRGMGYVIRAPR